MLSIWSSSCWKSPCWSLLGKLFSNLRLCRSTMRNLSIRKPSRTKTWRFFAASPLQTFRPDDQQHVLRYLSIWPSRKQMRARRSHRTEPNWCQTEFSWIGIRIALKATLTSRSNSSQFFSTCRLSTFHLIYLFKQIRNECKANMLCTCVWLLNCGPVVKARNANFESLLN